MSTPAVGTLHIISRRLDASTLASLWRSLNTGDALLLSCDGVYLGLDPELANRTGNCAALASDIIARGLDTLCPATIRRIDHAGFVALCVVHGKTVSWA